MTLSPFPSRGEKEDLLAKKEKAIRERSPSAPLALYDLQSDIAEKTNVAAQHPDLAAKLDSYLKTARSDSPPTGQSRQRLRVRNAARGKQMVKARPQK